MCTFVILGLERTAQNLVLEEVLDGLIGNHTLIKDVRALFGLHHLDDLGIAAAIGLTRLQGCDCFFCHGASVLFDFLVNRHALENRIILLQLKTLGGILSVLGGDVTGGAGEATLLHFSAFENHLYSVAFSFLCHVAFLRFKRFNDGLVTEGSPFRQPA